jgi:hypothetical protein
MKTLPAPLPQSDELYARTERSYVPLTAGAVILKDSVLVPELWPGVGMHEDQLPPSIRYLDERQSLLEPEPVPFTVIATVIEAPGITVVLEEPSTVTLVVFAEACASGTLIIGIKPEK